MSANTTPTIPETFCPAKWDEIVLNLNYNYAYACCKATPIKFYNDYNEIISSQKENLLGSVQDTSCEYCWQVEKHGGKSLRHEYLATFDVTTFDNYKNNNVPPKFVEINLGNECNIQCVYCNPKFSSKWDADVRKQPYKIFVDKFNYEPADKTLTAISNQTLLHNFTNIQDLNIIGGEPLVNKNFWPIVENSMAENLSFSTNLQISTATIDRVFQLAEKYKKVRFTVSLEATERITSFVRSGIDYSKVVSNIEYVIQNLPLNFELNIASLITSLTVRDLGEFTKLVEKWHSNCPSLQWQLSYCVTPKLQSFSTLPDTYRQVALTHIQYAETLPYSHGAGAVASALANTPFNETLHKQVIHFYKEFASRKNITLPLCLD